MSRVKKIGFKGLVKYLHDFEAQYGMSSADFFHKFSKGELGDAGDFIMWAGLYETYLDLAPQTEKHGHKSAQVLVHA